MPYFPPNFCLKAIIEGEIDGTVRLPDLPTFGKPAVDFEEDSAAELSLDAIVCTISEPRRFVCRDGSVAEEGIEVFGGELLAGDFFFCFGDLEEELASPTVCGECCFSFGGVLCREMSVLDPLNLEESRESTDGVEAFFVDVLSTSVGSALSKEVVEGLEVLETSRSSAGLLIITFEEAEDERGKV